jgi:hypothetical protein
MTNDCTGKSSCVYVSLCIYWGFGGGNIYFKWYIAEKVMEAVETDV